MFSTIFGPPWTSSCGASQSDAKICALLQVGDTGGRSSAFHRSGEKIVGFFGGALILKDVSMLEEASVLVVNEADKQNLADILQIICRIGIVYALYIADELERVRVQ